MGIIQPPSGMDQPLSISAKRALLRGLLMLMLFGASGQIGVARNEDKPVGVARAAAEKADRH